MGVLRFLLATSVLWAHAKSNKYFLVDAGVAVEAFFIISGFLITMVLKEKYTGSLGFKAFIENRFLRLLPSYYTILILIVTVSFISLYIFNNPLFLKGFLYYGNILHPSAFLFLVISNLFILGQDLFFFLRLDTLSGHLSFTSEFLKYKPIIPDVFMINPVSWSLAPELYFYLTAFWTVKKLERIVIIFAVSFIVKLCLYFNGFNYDPWVDRFFFPAEIGFFMLGAIMYYILIKYRTQLENFKRIHYQLLYLTTIIVTLIYPILVKLLHTHWFYFIIIALMLPLLFINTKNNKLDKFMADLSYPIYISHFFVLTILRDLAGTNHNLPITVLIFTILISVLLIKYIERPINKIREQKIKTMQTVK